MATLTASKPRKSGKRLGYMDVITQASKPLENRREMAIGRGGAKIKPRKFHLSDEEIAELRQLHNEGDKLPNPQNRGSYFYIIEAGKALGLNRKHPVKEVISKIRELMSDKETRDADGKTAWQRFRDKAPSTDREEGGLDEVDRIIQNMEVLQRVNLTSTTPYGLKLLQVGQKVLKTKGVVIDLLKGATDKEILFRINTDAAVPTNELKRRRVATGDAPATKTVKTAKPKASKPKATKVAAAPKAKAPKAKVVKSEHPASDKVTAAAAPASDAKSDVAASEPTGEIEAAV